MSVPSIIVGLKSKGNAKNVEGMARFGISSKNTLGVSIPSIRSLARKVGTNHQIALKLWETGIHEARILAAMVDDPKEVTVSQMERWVEDFDSWDVCDQCCGVLFDKTPQAFAKPRNGL